jgi:hypothetical protein
MGSLEPLSTSSVLARRGGSRSPPERSTEKTAAASVDPMMLPSSSPTSRGTPRIQVAAAPVISAVSRTPTVASENAGASVGRTDANEVRRPPSNRITARATVPKPCASA